MTILHKLKRSALAGGALLTVALVWQGCAFQPEHLYALKLAAPPTDKDWALSVPLLPDLAKFRAIEQKSV
jgi:hypothetical protein